MESHATRPIPQRGSLGGDRSRNADTGAQAGSAGVEQASSILPQPDVATITLPNDVFVLGKGDHEPLAPGDSSPVKPGDRSASQVTRSKRASSPADRAVSRNIRTRIFSRTEPAMLSDIRVRETLSSQRNYTIIEKTSGLPKLRVKRNASPAETRLRQDSDRRYYIPTTRQGGGSEAGTCSQEILSMSGSYKIVEQKNRLPRLKFRRSLSPAADLAPETTSTNSESLVLAVTLSPGGVGRQANSLHTRGTGCRLSSVLQPDEINATDYILEALSPKRDTSRVGSPQSGRPNDSALDSNCESTQRLLEAADHSGYDHRALGNLQASLSREFITSRVPSNELPASQDESTQETVTTDSPLDCSFRGPKWSSLDREIASGRLKESLASCGEAPAVPLGPRLSATSGVSRKHPKKYRNLLELWRFWTGELLTFNMMRCANGPPHYIDSQCHICLVGTAWFDGDSGASKPLSTPTFSTFSSASSVLDQGGRGLRSAGRVNAGDTNRSRAARLGTNRARAVGQGTKRLQDVGQSTYKKRRRCKDILIPDAGIALGVLETSRLDLIDRGIFGISDPARPMDMAKFYRENQAAIVMGRGR